jgi:hypothetical protein
MHRLAAINALHRGTALAAEIACADPKRRAWIGVYPLDLSRASTREFLRNSSVEIFPPHGRAYHVRTFEVDRALHDKGGSLGETDLINKNSAVAFNDEDLIQKLRALDSSLESLELPFKSGYPI